MLEYHFLSFLSSFFFSYFFYFLGLGFFPFGLRIKKRTHMLNKVPSQLTAAPCLKIGLLLPSRNDRIVI